MAGQPITLTIPAVGTAGTAYASQINTALSALETELERKVVPADMSMSANLSFLSGALNYSITDLKRLSLVGQDPALLTAAAFPMALFATSPSGDLYFNNNAGNQIQITAAGTVNVASAGGVTGAGYGTSDVVIQWVGVDTEYRLRKGSAADAYANVRLDDVFFNDGSSNAVRLGAQSMAADWTLTLPAAAPASTSVVLMDATGVLSTTRAPSVDSVTTTTLAVTSTSTFTGKPTFVAEPIHPTRSQHFAAVLGFLGTGTGAVQPGGHVLINSSASSWAIPLPLIQGQRVTSIDFHISTSATAGTRTLELLYYNNTVGAMIAPGGAYATTYTGVSTRTTVNLNLTDFTVGAVNATGTAVGLLFARLTGIVSDEFWGVTVNYTRI